MKRFHNDTDGSWIDITTTAGGNKAFFTNTGRRYEIDEFGNLFDEYHKIGQFTGGSITDEEISKTLL